MPRKTEQLEDESMDSPSEGRDPKADHDGYTTVLVTSSRASHPDQNPLGRGYFSNYPEDPDGKLAVNVLVHRLSDGNVRTRHRHAHTGAELVVMCLGQFEAGFPNYRSFTLEEYETVLDVLADMTAEGVLAKKAPVLCEFGIEGKGWKPRTPPPAPPAEPEPTTPEAA